MSHIMVLCKSLHSISTLLVMLSIISTYVDLTNHCIHATLPHYFGALLPSRCSHKPHPLGINGILTIYGMIIALINDICVQSFCHKKYRGKGSDYNSSQGLPVPKMSQASGQIPGMRSARNQMPPLWNPELPARKSHIIGNG